MKYDPTRKALYKPETGRPLDPALFAARPDALAAELARFAYWKFENGHDELARALSGHGLEWAAGFVDAATNTQAFACHDGAGTAYVAFRGTQSDDLRDLLTDLQAWPTGSFGPGMAHAGFVQAYCGKTNGSGNPVRPNIREWIAQAVPTRLVLTGHSLGAALATLCAIDNPSAELVTIGSPRVGNGDFAAAFAGRKIRRYVDCCDVVTTVPPPVGHKHVGELFYIDRHGAVHRPPPNALEMLDDQAKANLEYVPLALGRLGTVEARNFADHAPINYISAMLGIRQPI